MSNADYVRCECGHWPYSHVEEKGCLGCGCMRLTDGSDD